MYNNGQLLYEQHATYEEWTRLNGKTYYHFLRKVGMAKKDIIMFYMSDGDYRAKNMIK